MSQFSYLVANMIVNDMPLAACKLANSFIFGQILHVYLTIKAKTCRSNHKLDTTQNFPH